MRSFLGLLAFLAGIGLILGDLDNASGVPVPVEADWSLKLLGILLILITGFLATGGFHVERVKRERSGL